MKNKEGTGKGKRVSITVSLVGILIILLVASIFISKFTSFNIWGYIFPGSEHKLTTISESTLEDVIEISDLSTVEYFFNSITEVQDEKTGDLKYHVAYEGVVDAGIDLSEVKVSVDNEKKVIIQKNTTKIQVKCAITLDIIAHFWYYFKY